MIRLSGVTKAFGPLEVLRGFDLEVRAGETVAVIGRSGSGKSVLLKHVARLLEPDRGEVWIGGEEISHASREKVRELRARLGYVFQFAALFDSMTLGDNVRMALRRQVATGEVGEGEMEERVERSLEVVGLAGMAGRFPSELSGGMRKRAGVARAIAADPKYLLYDEPTTGLDPVTTARIDELIVRLKHDLRATSIVVTHEMASAYRVADRIAMLYEGRAHAVGTPEEIRASRDPIVRSFVERRTDLWPGE